MGDIVAEMGLARGDAVRIHASSLPAARRDDAASPHGHCQRFQNAVLPSDGPTTQAIWNAASMSKRIINGADELKALVGEHLGYSPWVDITQEQVNMFAEATGDHQWIHVDVERATAGPFGAPIAHGYLTLSLGPMLYPQVVEIRGFTMGVNYGTNKVRFMSPVPVGSRLRLGVKILDVADIAGGVQNTLEFTFEVEGAAKPSCVAEVVFRSYE